MQASTVLLLSLAAFSAASGQLLFKVGADGVQNASGYINLSIFAGLVLYGLGTMAWIYALSSELLVNVYAFTALTFVLVYLGGVVLLGETITRPALAGVAFVLFGLYLIAVHGR